MSAGFFSDETLAIDATHVKVRNRTPNQSKKVELNPEKRGRKKKEEREQYLIEKAEIKKNLPIYEQNIADQLEVSLKELRSSVPIQPKWRIKKNSEGKNVFWYGFKCHLAVGTTSQYNLQSLFSSGNLNDGKTTIPLLNDHLLKQVDFDINVDD